MSAALLLIGVEQCITGLSTQDARELPGEIGDIANALAHALTDERRLLVGGVSGEEDAPRAPFAGDQGMKAIARRPPQRRILRREPARQQLPDLFGLLHRARILTRQQHDLKAPMRAWPDDIGGRARRIAELRRRARQLR